MLLKFIFAFFCFGVTGWVLESLQETIVRRKFVNKGFFKGPFTLSHAIGGVAIYAVSSPFSSRPWAVFLSGLVICTIVEYIMALFLEKCFKVKCWDYHTYPHTRWCHFQGRICLTISLFFGAAALFIVYVYWGAIMRAAEKLGSALFWVVAALVAAFFVDVITTCVRVFKANKKGERITGWAVFSKDTR